MPLIYRRVLYGKPGTADQIVQLLRESGTLARRYAPNTKMRILVDHFSGRSDRVVAEVEIKDTAEFMPLWGRSCRNLKPRPNTRHWKKEGSNSQIIPKPNGGGWFNPWLRRYARNMRKLPNNGKILPKCGR
ncbi:MAG: hypothetical protein HYX87_07695 [Chloroflexi bacterium]|nr:hypothetical protein [Chloroflexota bacterium]